MLTRVVLASSVCFGDFRYRTWKERCVRRMWQTIGVSLGVAASIGTAGAESTALPDKDRAAIAAVVAQEDAAWAHGDSAAFSANVTPDVVFTNIVGAFSIGKAPFQAQHAGIFATIYKGSTLKQSIAHIAFPRFDIAIVDTVARVTNYQRLPPGSEAIDGALQTRLEQVMVRENGRWMVASFHNVPINPIVLQEVTTRP